MSWVKYIGYEVAECLYHRKPWLYDIERLVVNVLPRHKVPWIKEDVARGKIFCVNCLRARQYIGPSTFVFACKYCIDKPQMQHHDLLFGQMLRMAYIHATQVYTKDAPAHVIFSWVLHYASERLEYLTQSTNH